MRRLAYFLVAFSALAGIVTWRVKAQTVGDDLAVALVNHGVDAVTAPVAAAAIEIAVANSNALITRVGNDEAAIAKLQQQVAALTPAPVALLKLAADKTASSSGAVTTIGTSDTASIDGLKVILAAGQVYTYNFSIATAGTYSPFARFCNGTGSTGNLTVHFEMAPGVSAGGELTLAGGVQWTNLVANSQMSLPAGPFSLRLVVDTVAAGGSFADVVGLQ